MKALEDAELFKLLVPRRLGGMYTNIRSMMECIAEIARGDGSTAWAAALLNACTGFATTFSEQAPEGIFDGDSNARACCILTPPSNTERVEGGYLVSGLWGYASGSFAATWGALGIKLDVPEEEDPRCRRTGRCSAGPWLLACAASARPRPLPIARRAAPGRGGPVEPADQGERGGFAGAVAVRKVQMRSPG